MDYTAAASQAFDSWGRDKPARLAVDTETHGLGWFDTAFCATLTWRDAAGVLSSHYVDLEYTPSAAHRWLGAILLGTPTLIGHNLRFDLQKLIQAGVITRESLTPDRLEDTATLAHLLDEHRPKKLKGLAVDLLDVDDTVNVTIMSGPNKGKTRQVSKEKYELDAVRRKLKVKMEDGYGVLPREVVIPYALKDTEYTLGVWEVLRPQVAEWPDLDALYHLEMELMLVVLDMEATAFQVDIEYAQRMTRRLGGEVLGVERDIGQLLGRRIGKDAGAGDFNPASPKQLLDVFAKRGHTLESTDDEALTGMDDPLAKLITTHRKLSKLRTTYFLAILRETQEVDGRCLMHPGFNTTETVTGRFSSSTHKGD